LWWQFYPREDMDASRELLERAQASGYTAIVVTVDQQASC
jgi:isopentenyl diphosphate isomerase/L-lactate dehydrogenase-like FMN-dependent dehydrogenase